MHMTDDIRIAGDDLLKIMHFAIYLQIANVQRQT